MASISKGGFTRAWSARIPICSRCQHSSKVAKIFLLPARQQQTRPLSLSSRLLAKLATTPKTNKLAKVAPELARPESQSRVELLSTLSTTTPTVIYQAPSHATLYGATFMLAGLFTGYGLYAASVPHTIAGPGSIGKIEPLLRYGMYFCGLVMTCMGTWAFTTLRMLVRRIELVPVDRSMSRLGFMAKIYVRRTPLMWAKRVVEVPLENVSLARRVQDIAPEHVMKVQYADNIVGRIAYVGKRFFQDTKSVFFRAAFVSLIAKRPGSNKEQILSLDARGDGFKGAGGLDKLIVLNRSGGGRFYDSVPS